MKSKDWFIVGMRLFGIWMLLSALAEAISFAEAHFQMVTLRTTTESAYLFHGGVDLVAALVLLIYARFIAGLFDWPLSSPNECAKCGYDLRGSPDQCPECGTARTGPR